MRTARLLFPFFLALAACESVPEQGVSPTSPTAGPGPPPLQEPPKPTPWTSSFQSSAILVADEIRIEGPKGLLEHVATRTEPDHHDYEAKTLPEGFQQVFTPKVEGVGVEMSAYLDAWRLAALRRLVLLERPGDVDVVVSATGNVFWQDLTTGAEKRASTLVLRGDPPE